MSWSDVREATRPSDEAVARVRGQLGLDPIPASVRAEPTRAQVQRLALRIDRKRRRRAPRLVLVPVAAVPVLAAAAALLWVLWPEPAPVPVELAMADEGSVQLSEHVALRWEGEGAVSGTESDVRVAWSTGTVKVEVEPDRGVKLRIDTGEASVRVVGTGFTVARTDLGTEVTVSHGQVEVACGSGGGAVVGPLQAHTCLPTTPGGLLNRARQLEQEPDKVLATVDAALGMDPEPLTRGELLAQKFVALYKLQRWDEALAAADAYLASGGLRPDVRRHAARVAEQVGCEKALVYLRGHPDPTPDETAHLERCEAAVGAR